MANLPWEPCPRCGEKQVEVTPASSQARMSFGMLAGIGFVIYLAIHVLSGSSSFGMGILVVLILVALLSPAIATGSAIVGGLAGSVVKGYRAKCKTCSYEWEITEERAKELQAQMPAR